MTFFIVCFENISNLIKAYLTWAATCMLPETAKFLIIFVHNIVVNEIFVFNYSVSCIVWRFEKNVSVDNGIKTLT